MASCLTLLQESAWSTFSGSGHNINQLGNYNECIDTTGMTYNFVKFALSETKQQSGYYIGLCLPTECGKDIVTIGLNTLLATLKLPLEVHSVNTAVQDYQWPFDWTFYATIIVLISMFGLVVYSTIAQWLQPTKGNILVSSFSIQSSTKLFKRNPKSTLNVLNGVRSISMGWVVIGHVMSFGLGSSINAPTVYPHYLNRTIFLFVEGGILAVDVFFYVGGFLVAYALLRNKPSSSAGYLLGILQRALRLWPSYLVAIMILYGLFMHMGYGPLWQSAADGVSNCQHSWQSLLFMDNFFYNGAEQCLAWGWYLQNDMQLFIISMGLLFIYNKNAKIGKFTIIVCTLASTAFTYIYATNIDQHVFGGPQTDEGLDYQQNVYIKPWARAPPYLVGVFLGILFNEYSLAKKQHQKATGQQIDKSLLLSLHLQLPAKKWLRIVIEMLGVVLMLFIILIPRTLQLDILWPQWCHSLHLSLSRPLFVIGLTFTLLPSMLGVQNTLVATLLDTQLFNFVAKISFCTYLLHLMVIVHWNLFKKIDFYYTLLDEFVIFLGILVLSLFLGWIMTIIIEMPCGSLQKHFMNSLKKKHLSNQEKSQQYRKI